MVRRILLVCLVLSFLIVPGAWGTLIYTGSIGSDKWEEAGANPYGLYSNDGWSDAVLSWKVYYSGGLYTYQYTFTDYGTGPSVKDISHGIIEVSATFESVNIIDIYTGDGGETTGEAEPEYTLGTFSNSKNEPKPVDIYGIKVDGLTNGLSWTIVTNREPMWGDFYAIDGGSYNPTVDDTGWVYAYNTGFGSEAPADYEGIPLEDFKAWVIVPDTEGGIPPAGLIPEPATLLLIGAGLIGFAGLGRKYFK
ncbi:MAG: PEP-CTERM sorting domain-containing protein [Desulfatiglandales bacterium]